MGTSSDSSSATDREVIASRMRPFGDGIHGLPRLVRDMEDMLRRAIGEGVDVETIVAGGLWNCFIDPAFVSPRKGAYRQLGHVAAVDPGHGQRFGHRIEHVLWPGLPRRCARRG